MVLRELTLTYKPSPVPIERPCMHTAREAATVARPLLEGEPMEVFGAFMLNTQRLVLCWKEISRGSLSATIVTPRDVFFAAVHANAHSVILAHNHPSGDPAPSANDRELTIGLKVAGGLLGIDVVDHIIIGEGGRYASFKDLGWL